MNDERVCRNCRWRSDEFTSACTNGESPKRGDFVMAEDTCMAFEEKNTGRDVLMSIHPKWVKLIVEGKKVFEVRKRAPLQMHPYKVYVYCTKNGEEMYRAGVTGRFDSYRMNGTVCGEFICTRTIEQRPPWPTEGTCLTAKELWKYAKTDDKLAYMVVEDAILYEKPKRLSEFGVKHAPMSWVYLGGEKRE